MGGIVIHHLFVPGRSRPKGDLKYGLSGRSGSGRVRLFYPSVVKAWQEQIGWVARSEIGTMIEGPVALSLRFMFEGKHLGPHTLAPDIDKIVRAVLDALSGIAYADDRQVALVVASKQWGAPMGVHITVASTDELWAQVIEEQVPLGV